MTDTVISSATKEVVIGFDRPFVIIGERINPTGRKILAAEMAAGDFTRVEADARAQVEAGAHMLDVNAGIPLADEPAILARAIQLVQSITDVPLSIDSSIVAALEAGLAVYKGKALVNSVTGEDERLESVLPLIKKYGAAVIAISNDETGISEDPDVRYAVAKKIVERAMDHGIPACDVVVDPLVMPIGAINQAGVQVMRLVHRLRTELKVNTSCGASNISFGLPNRDGINSAFLTMAMGAGMTSAITNPLHVEVIRACMGADVMLGHDPDCARWIRRFRDSPSSTGTGAAAARPQAQAGRRRAAAAKAAIAGARPSRRRFAWRHAIRSWCSRRPASAGILPSARRCCRPRAVSAWTSTRSAAAAVCAGAARCWSRRASSPSTASSSSSASLSPFSEPETAFLAARAVGGRPPPVLFRARRGRCGHRRAREQPGPSSGGAQGGRRARHQARSGGAPALRAGQAAGHARSVGRSAPAVRSAGIGVEPHGSHLRFVGAAIAAADIARRRLAGHGRGARRQADHRSLARAARTGLRTCGRHRFHDDRRASVRFEQRRGRGLRRRR